MITAPFNFVPLNEKVYHPDWADQVSHDIPFEDGESGEIEITLTAKSPIFVRDHDQQTRFCHYKDTFFIPGSSVKGMVRSVLETISFSKMRPEVFDDNTYAVRDLRNRELYMSKMKPENTYCGWLKKTEDGYVIEDCGIPGRIRHEEIDKIYDIKFAAQFKQGKFKNKAADKTAFKKYNLIKSKEFRHRFRYLKKDVNREIYEYDENGPKEGTLVLTGQPSARKEPHKGKPSGKIYEFIFFDSKRELPVDKSVYENFLFAYFDKRETEPKESPDWTFWKKRLQQGEKVPVFFQKEGNRVAHFGLSYLYKLPYKHSIGHGIPQSHKDTKADLAQTIFGYVEKSTNSALKGRVQFSHFKAVQNVKELQSRTEILGTPRASYYPMYIRQRDGNLYKTYMDEDFSIAGRKRYPVHESATPKKTVDTGNENVGTHFQPLDKGVVFKGKLRYHNLKKAELGALLSALTFHNTPATFHSLGLAKSLGYGKVEITLEGLGKDDIRNYLKAFESDITLQIPNWIESPQLKELLTMASEQNNSGNSELAYMELKEFAANKRNESRDYLRPYTRLDNIIPVTPESAIDESDLEELRVKQAEREAQEQAKKEQQEREAEGHRQKEEAERLYKEALQSDNIQILQNFLDKYPEHEKAGKIARQLEIIRQQQQKNRHQKVNKQAKHAYEALQKNRSNLKKYTKDKEKFIKKWSADKNNKGSEYILELVQKLKEEK